MEERREGECPMERLKPFAVLIGRILQVLIFLKSGLGKIENFLIFRNLFVDPKMMIQL
jgi:uncharacterized membrane protein YphA (DoxX/SURF4 family)